MDIFTWEIAILGYKDYLVLERSLSKNSVSAYLRDMKFLQDYAMDSNIGVTEFSRKDATDFLASLSDKALSRTSVNRILSAIRGFFNYLIINDIIETSPMELIETVRIERKLPDVLSYSDILKMFESIDLSEPLAHRNRAILEMLYGCGLRATELTELTFDDIFEKENILRVVGKGNKQRLTPIAHTTLKFLKLYLEERKGAEVKRGSENIVFLNRRGSKLSRVMIFNIVKEAAERAGINNNIHPHTLRHSFATHLVEGGADIRAVQEMLGHQSITTTEIYTHISLATLRNAVEQLRPEAPTSSDRP